MIKKNICHPDFLIIGSMKSGTTTLYDDLRKLDRVHLPSDKEPQILARYTSLEEMKAAYAFHYHKARDGEICGEASTAYTSRPIYEGIPQRAFDLCGKELRLLMIMRDPLERIYSHLRHNVAGRHISVKQVDRVVFEDPEYVAISNYAMQLKPWVERFGAENLKCISFREFKKDRYGTLCMIAKFLGVSPPSRNVDVYKISNKSDELRRTGDLVGAVLQSRLYRRSIRPLLPDKVRLGLRSVLLPRTDVPEIRLSYSSEQRLKEMLGNVETDLEQLIGMRLNLYDS